MARIKGVTPDQAGVGVKLAFFFTRRQLTKLTGRAPERMVEPVEMLAHIPPLLAAYGKLEQATSKLHELDERTRMLAELKAATLTGCEYCIDLGSQVARNSGLSDDELLALPRYRASPLFSAVDRLVLEYVAGVSSTPVDVSDELFARLSAHFTAPQLVELTYVVALENLRGRFNLALGVGAAGFSEGRVCAVPASVPEQGS